MKILVTGGSGFIGHNLVELLRDRYDIAAPSSSDLDLLDADAVRQYLCSHRFDVVVHAATTRSNRRTGAPADMLDRNCRMFFNLVRNDGLFGKMIFFGSGAEFERSAVPPRVSEDYFDTRVPTDPYGFSKYIAAKYIERSDRKLNLRLFGVFGRYEDYSVRFISNACCRALKGLPIVIRQDVRFDYLDVNDLARITTWFVEHDSRFKTYNVSSNRSYLLSELAQMVREISGRIPAIIVKNEGLGPEYTASGLRLLNEIGTFTFSEMFESIRELYTWYSENEDKIDPRALEFDN
jgi:UDP-glucose 4-epimerase